MASNYWIGPYGILVPNNINHVVASDGGNIFYKDGRETEMFVVNPVSEEEYKKRYAQFNDIDKMWYYIRPKPHSFHSTYLRAGDPGDELWG